MGKKKKKRHYNLFKPQTSLNPKPVYCKLVVLLLPDEIQIIMEGLVALLRFRMSLAPSASSFHTDGDNMVLPLLENSFVFFTIPMGELTEEIPALIWLVLIVVKILSSTLQLQLSRFFVTYLKINMDNHIYVIVFNRKQHWQ